MQTHAPRGSLPQSGQFIRTPRTPPAYRPVYSSTGFCRECSLVLPFGVKHYSLGERDYCDKLPLVLGEYRCQLKSHKTSSIVQIHREVPGMKISDRLSVSADICLPSIYRTIGILIKTHIGEISILILFMNMYP